MAEPTLLQQARQRLDMAESSRPCAGAAQVSNIGIALRYVLQHLEQREADVRGPAQVPGEPHTVDMHKFTLQPGKHVRLPDGRHVQNMSNTVIWLDVDHGAVRAGVDAPAVPEDELTELQQLCDAATAAPWELDSEELYVLGGTASPVFTLETDDDGDAQQAALAAAKLAIAARDALPKLIARVRALQAELASVNADCAECGKKRTDETHHWPYGHTFVEAKHG